MSGEYYVRAYNPETDIEEWHGPLPMHMAGLVAEGLEGWQTRVYHGGELPGMEESAVVSDHREAEQ